MRFQLKDDEFLTDSDLAKLAKMSDKGLKRLYMTYNNKAKNVNTALRIIVQNKIVVEQSELDKLILKKKRYGWIGFNVWSEWVKRTTHIGPGGWYHGKKKD